jgi:cyclopropane fatty-acyl-phospholipid synthase-like methyltransferase
MSRIPEVPADWYTGFFEGAWLDHVALHTDPERTAEQVEFIADKLGIEPGARVLDLACGHGRITIELARRGYSTTGIDLSPRSLELAREAAEREGLEVEWVHADMRDIPPGSKFDAVVNVFTSFGYFEEEKENQRVLDGVERALAPGGRFLIDVVNLLGLARRYRETAWEERDGVLFLQEHRFEFLRGRNTAVWTFVSPDGARSELAHSLRTYASHELAAMLVRAGLELDDAWGGFDGSELSFDSWRSIMLAHKP